MGSSKVIMLGGIFIIIGMYALAFKTADTSQLALVDVQVSQDQAREIARSGIDMVINTLATQEDTTRLPVVRNRSIFGGTLSYEVRTRRSDYVTMVSTGTFNSQTITLRAELALSSTQSSGKGKIRTWDRWQVVGVFQE